MVEREWIQESEAHEMEEKAKEMSKEYTRETEPTMLVLNIGEGWRSVGRALKNLVPGAYVAGADRRGHRAVTQISRLLLNIILLYVHQINI